MNFLLLFFLILNVSLSVFCLYSNSKLEKLLKQIQDANKDKLVRPRRLNG